MECMIYSSKYKAILKIMLLYLVEYRGMHSRFDFLLDTARPYVFLVGGFFLIDETRFS